MGDQEAEEEVVDGRLGGATGSAEAEMEEWGVGGSQVAESWGVGDGRGGRG